METCFKKLKCSLQNNVLASPFRPCFPLSVKSHGHEPASNDSSQHTSVHQDGSTGVGAGLVASAGCLGRPAALITEFSPCKLPRARVSEPGLPQPLSLMCIRKRHPLGVMQFDQRILGWSSGLP